MIFTRDHTIHNGRAMKTYRKGDKYEGSQQIARRLYHAGILEPTTEHRGRMSKFDKEVTAVMPDVTPFVPVDVEANALEEEDKGENE